MAVVVSDTTPLHYLILIGRESVLEKLYRQVVVPPAVLQELAHPAAPAVISAWAKSPPAWLTVQAPAVIPPRYDNLDFGERQALALAKEIHADFVLLDDKVARRFAESEALKVKGTLGIVADAAKAGLLNFQATVETLQQSTMHLDAKLAQRLIEEYEKGQTKGKGE
jgi:predicted nucleic acid-binding protein